MVVIETQTAEADEVKKVVSVSQPRQGRVGSRAGEEGGPSQGSLGGRGQEGRVVEV
jgi:hypothetical protein